MAQKRAGNTVKVSISLDKDDLAALKRCAKKSHGGNLSAAVAEAARIIRQREARWELIEMLGGPTLTPEAAAAIDAELAGGPRYEPEKLRPKKAKAKKSRVIGFTFDTGALIALERRRQRMRELVERAATKNWRITAPADVVAEWWRGRTDARDRILASVEVEPLTETLAKIAGEALAAIEEATLVDAIVMASAASRGDIVFTSDIDDLERLRRHFPSVRVLAV